MRHHARRMRLLSSLHDIGRLIWLVWFGKRLLKRCVGRIVCHFAQRIERSP